MNQPRVFISYSRKDGEDFAAELRRRLEAEGLSLWQDRAHMKGGVGWWKQITDALDAVTFMVLVATPEAISSPIVRKEWRYARQQGVCVYPVQVPGLTIDFASLPKWMRDSHFYDLDHEWETFVNYLKSPCHALRVPFYGVPDLPKHFVERTEVFETLKAQLRDETRDNPVAITTSLVGAGGFGKTTLAAALCHDEDVQQAFDEGVLWVTLGENPNLLAILNGLYRVLTNEPAAFETLHEASARFTEKLADNDILLVVDDIWNSDHAWPFLQGGERCARLLTTRFGSIAVDHNAEVLEVDEMTHSEAVKLLLAGIDAPADRTRFMTLAKRLGEWPLMLEITNGMLREELREGATLDSALSFVNDVLNDEGVFGIERNNSDERKKSAEGVLAASFHQLSNDERARLCELSIFVEDIDVPVTSVQVLYDISGTRTRKLLGRFARGSFIRYDRARGVIRLHDVVREVLASRLHDPEVVHAQLIDNYGDLTALPDDYAWRNIASHLTRARLADRLRELMLGLRFMAAKLAATDPAALAADCALLKKGDPVMQIMGSFWQVSAHVLNTPENSDQLYNQLLGRLGQYEENHPDISTLLAIVSYDAENHPDPQLILMKPTLEPAGGMLERILVGHTYYIQGVMELQDGRLLSWSNENTLRLWGADGELLTTLTGHTETVVGVVELRNGRLLSWSRDNTLRLWGADGTLLATLAGHTSSIQGVMELRDGRLLSWSSDNTLRLWTADGATLATLAGHTDSVSGVMELRDGRLLSWSQDNTLRLWSADGSPLPTLTGHT